MLEKRSKIASINYLPELGNLEVRISNEILEDNQTISVSNWRGVIEAGDYEKAEKLLGSLAKPFTSLWTKSLLDAKKSRDSILIGN